MKTWTNPTVEELEVKNTAWGWDNRWYEWSIIYPAGGTGANQGDDVPGEDVEVPEEGYTPLS